MFVLIGLGVGGVATRTEVVAAEEIGGDEDLSYDLTLGNAITLTATASAAPLSVCMKLRQQLIT
ncbi:hypothetical protein J7E25_01390 [Agromyces sp. ISL-38]|uniref:hypothetical protein n=1 Tax=Agromyces sp. ISL-38 TaxID=2819107 RepID=UPI001BE943F7|nr:hypothetical protein [Agromyces sp. ISL-38]MBT2497741.1 hypothetical protein [Agromyces sp. ISL-38]